MIGMVNIQAPRRRIRLAQCLVNSACFAAARGTTTRTTCVPPSAAATRRASRTAASGSVSRGTPDCFPFLSFLFPLPLSTRTFASRPDPAILRTHSSDLLAGRHGVGTIQSSHGSMLATAQSMHDGSESSAMSMIVLNVALPSVASVALRRAAPKNCCGLSTIKLSKRSNICTSFATPLPEPVPSSSGAGSPMCHASPLPSLNAA